MTKQTDGRDTDRIVSGLMTIAEDESNPLHYRVEAYRLALAALSGSKAFDGVRPAPDVAGATTEKG